MTDQHWYAFRAYNTQALYGYGTKDEADEYCDLLNEGRNINFYGAHELTEDEADERNLRNCTL